MFRQAEERRKYKPNFLFSNQFRFYNALFFRVFSITCRENKVRHKYKTKNIKTDSKEVFLATINHTSANTISSRNLRLTATRIYKVWLSGFFDLPLKKMRRVIHATTVKKRDKIT